MDTDFIKKGVWLPFATSSRATERPYRGTGLGLFIAKTFADQLGVRLRVCSRKGYGTLFQVVLPPSMFTTSLGARSAAAATGAHGVRPELVLLRSSSLHDRTRPSTSLDEEARPSTSMPQSAPAISDMALTSQHRSAAHHGTNVGMARATSCEHDYFCRHRLRSRGHHNTSIFTESCMGSGWPLPPSSSAATTAAATISRPLTADTTQQEDATCATSADSMATTSLLSRAYAVDDLAAPHGMSRKRGDQHMSASVAIEQPSAHLHRYVSYDEGFIQQFRVHPGALVDHAAGSLHRRNISVDSQGHSNNHSRKSSISMYTDDSRTTPDADDEPLRQTTAATTNATTAAYSLNQAQHGHPLRRRDSRGRRRPGSSSSMSTTGTTVNNNNNNNNNTASTSTAMPQPRPRRHRRHRSLHAISSNWITVSDNEDEIGHAYSPHHRGWLSFPMSATSSVSPGEFVTDDRVASRAGSPDRFSAQSLDEVDVDHMATADALAPIREMGAALTNDDDDDDDEGDNTEKADAPSTTDEVVMVSAKALAMSDEAAQQPSTSTSTSTSTAAAAAGNDSGGAGVASAVPPKHTAPPQLRLSIPLSPWSLDVHGAAAMAFTCPTPPTTDEPIVSCTDWCPYFEGPSSLYALSGPPSASSFTAKTSRRMGATHEHTSYFASTVAPASSHGASTTATAPTTTGTATMPAATQPESGGWVG
ncbi:hypothetical protein SYNPS1DRAFT_30823 [Syncephalis pseudoplumigaleata]|nr:hypothetical protein SYNPS1DRAFT_30823 [Syncephalis pseudoplumigaleata]|eukprot:RKP23431.1 hypothetical protein SYNPS1DRAFT_30823 [Syncephalis pseudoplumigaleata]